LQANEKGLKEEFKNITKNYFEPEFAPSPWNSYELVLDENYMDVERRYAGLLPNECFADDNIEMSGADIDDDDEEDKSDDA